MQRKSTWKCILQMLAILYQAVDVKKLVIPAGNRWRLIVKVKELSCQVGAHTTNCQQT